MHASTGEQQPRPTPPGGLSHTHSHTTQQRKQTEGRRRQQQRRAPAGRGSAPTPEASTASTARNNAGQHRPPTAAKAHTSGVWKRVTTPALRWSHTVHEPSWEAEANMEPGGQGWGDAPSLVRYYFVMKLLNIGRCSCTKGCSKGAAPECGRDGGDGCKSTPPQVSKGNTVQAGGHTKPAGAVEAGAARVRAGSSRKERSARARLPRRAHHLLTRRAPRAAHAGVARLCVDCRLAVAHRRGSKEVGVAVVAHAHQVPAGAGWGKEQGRGGRDGRREYVLGSQRGRPGEPAEV